MIQIYIFSALSEFRVKIPCLGVLTKIYDQISILSSFIHLFSQTFVKISLKSKLNLLKDVVNVFINSCLIIETSTKPVRI